MSNQKIKNQRKNFIQGFWHKLQPAARFVKQKHSLPDYIPRSSEQVLLPPYQTKDANLYAFFVKSNHPERLQSVLDKYLNQRWKSGEGYRFETLMEDVMVSFTSLKIFSKNLPDSNRGWVFENEMIIWIATLAYRWDRRKNKGYVPDGVVFFPFTAYVDNGMAIASGREVYGFPKEEGKLVIPASMKDEMLFSADAVVFKKFAPDSHATWENIVKIHKKDKSLEIQSSRDLMTFTGMALKMLENLYKAKLNTDILQSFIKNLWRNSIQVAYLKQFRDATDPEKACYQAVIRHDVLVNGFNSGSILPGKFEISFGNYASHPLVEELGLPTKTKTDGCIYLNFQFLFDMGVEIWRHRT